PIGEVGAERDELKFFSRLKPSTSFVDAKKAALMFEGGIDDNGYRYANHIKVRENTTYGFRVIAYNGPTIVFTVMKHEPELSAETKFRILRYQPRGDRMVVFRIIRQDEDGAITILWKELDRQKAPKIEFAKGEKLADIRK
ncbi:MAG TPA: hypothetical protein VHQ01_09875, partial [Pyrinomonadaceae bacterium]|nr:hypothetical protein [Pyrinomonadaceae bacterium]